MIKKILFSITLLLCLYSHSFASDIVWQFSENNGSNGWSGTWTKTSGQFPGPVTFDGKMSQNASGTTIEYKVVAYLLGDQFKATRTDATPSGGDCHFAGTLMDGGYIVGSGLCTMPNSRTSTGAFSWGLITEHP